MKISAFCFVVFLVSAWAAEPSGKKENIDKAVDTLLDFMRRGFAIQHTYSTVLADYQGSLVQAHGLTLLNISTIQRTGSAYRYQPKVDDMTISGSFGLEQLQLNVEELTYKGDTFPASVHVGKNSATIQYTMYHKSKRICRTEWEIFQLDPVESLTLRSSNEKYNGLDLTTTFNTEILPELNEFFKTSKFLQRMNKEMDFCIRIFT